MPEQTPRTIAAPAPSPASLKPLPNRVFSVELAEDEEVEWAWTSAEGVSYVSGYTVVKKQP